MQFRTLSPVHLAYTNPRTQRKEHLHPDHREYEQWLFVNLCSKYAAVPGNAPQTFDREEFAFRVIGPRDPRRHLITLKEGRTDQTQLRAYSFALQLTAPLALMEVAYHAGLGQKNSMGFGMLGIYRTEEEQNNT
jgi:CRISPR-associated endoribonuclease Cas6